MVSIIVGGKGSGKTKKMIEIINTSASGSAGNLVCIEHSMKLTYDIHHDVRLIDMVEYNIENSDMLFGFISGILAGNYDIVEIYIDGILKVLNKDIAELERLLKKLDSLTGDNIKLIVTVSVDENELGAEISKYTRAV